MTKVFNTHIEAARYVIENPTKHRVIDSRGNSIYVDKYGDFRCGGSMTCNMKDFKSPFTAVEPEKTNEDYIHELLKLDDTYQSDRGRSLARKWLEIMDEKIKKAKDE